MTNPGATKKVVTRSAEETERLGTDVARELKAGEVLVLRGGLGSGKTTFVRGLARGLQVDDPQGVSSPSYTIVNEYPGEKTLIHVDLYRLETGDEIESLALEDLLSPGAVMVIEWGEKMPPGMNTTRTIDFEIIDDERREINVS